MSELPAGWAMATLADLAAVEPRAITDGPFGSNLKSSHYTSSGPRVIRLQNIGDGVFKDEEAHISEAHYERLRTHSVDAGDLIVASLGTDLPRACLVPTNVPPAIVKADCIRVRLHQSVNAQYVNFALQRPELRRMVEAQIHGIGRPRLGMAGIKALQIPLAPPSEQILIVTAIEEHFSRIDAAAKCIADMASKLSRYWMALLHSHLGGTWPLRPLADIADTQLGKMLSQKSKLGVGAVRYVRNRNVQWGKVVLDEVAEMDFTEQEREKFLLRNGDVLVCEGGEVGRAAIWRDEITPCCFQKALHRVRPHPDLSAEYLVFVLQYLHLTGKLEPFVTGVTIKHLPQEDLRLLPIPSPPRAVQDQIVTDLKTGLSRLEHLESDVQMAEAKVRALRDALLSHAFSGRLTLRCPNEGPVTDLLDRISTEREASSKSSSQKKKVSL